MVRTPNCPCGFCHKNIPDHCKAIFCNNCNLWVHIKCNNISNSEYLEFQNEADDVLWFCLQCTKIMFPFGQLDNDELLNLYDFDLPSFLDSMPSFEITSGLSNLPNLDDYDIDEHLPSQVNSNYHTFQELSTLNTSENDLSLFHMNVRSLSLHFDELISTLSTLKTNFDIIGLSETWNSFENPVKTNVEIPGYSYFSYQSHSQNGGVALYVKSSLSPTPRPDLSRDSTSFETVWVEVENRNGSNYLFCCAYRHPCSDLDSFNEYLQEILSNPAVSKKQIFILGDFNVNLLNFNSDTPTTNYINFLFSNQFLPHIIHHFAFLSC